MNKNIKDFIFFTDKEDIDKLNHEIQGNFLLKRDEIKDENIEKVQFDNLKFIFLNRKKIKKEY